MRLGAFSALILSALIVLVSAAQAAPPANDNFDAAVTLTGNSGSIAGSNAEATREPGEPDHAGGTGGRSVWYRLTATDDRVIRLDTCTAASFDTVLAVYTGSAANALTREAANDDACELRSRVTFQGRAGTTYHIAVDGLGTSSGTFTLSWQLISPPANDNFAAAVPISGARGSVAGANVGATTEPGEPVHGSASVGATVWYAWTAPITGGVTFQTCGASEFDTVLVVYTGTTLSSLAFVAGNDDACDDVLSRVRFSTRAGTTYWIAVAGFVAGSSGPFQLSWTGAASPPNDSFTAARRITGARGSVTGQNVGASAEPGERAHAARPASASMWYRWRAPRTARVSFETCGGASFDTVLAVYRGTALRRLRQVGANDDACRTGSRVTFTARAGTVYRIVVDGYAAGTGTFRLRWRRPSPALLACRVPDVRGVTLPQAREAIARAKCSLGRIRYVRSRRVPPGFVAAQRPRPGTRMVPPRRVQLDVSRGRR